MGCCCCCCRCLVDTKFMGFSCVQETSSNARLEDVLPRKKPRVRCWPMRRAKRSLAGTWLEDENNQREKEKAENGRFVQTWKQDRCYWQAQVLLSGFAAIDRSNGSARGVVVCKRSQLTSLDRSRLPENHCVAQFLAMFLLSLHPFHPRCPLVPSCPRHPVL